MIVEAIVVAILMGKVLPELVEAGFFPKKLTSVSDCCVLCWDKIGD